LIWGITGQKITRSGGRLTVNTPGRYVARAVAWYGTAPVTGGKNKEISFRLNASGGADRLGAVLTKEEPAPVSMETVYVFDMSTGNTLDVFVYQNSGVNFNMWQTVL
jgi:hypothetical protein